MLFDTVLSTLNYLADRKRDRKESDDAAQNQVRLALHSINQALNETKQYLEKSQGEKCFERGVEYKLAELWRTASINVMNLKEFDPGFPASLNEKAFYWESSAQWDEAKIKSKGIAIEQIENQLRKILK